MLSLAETFQELKGRMIVFCKSGPSIMEIEDSALSLCEMDFKMTLNVGVY